MYLIKGVVKSNGLVKRYGYSFSLEDSARELMKQYAGANKSNDNIEVALSDRINACFTGDYSNRQEWRSHLYSLMRTRDWHRFVVRDKSAEMLKRRILRTIVNESHLGDRWLRVRDLLLEHIDSWLAELPATGGDALSEQARLDAVNEQLSLSTSTIGQILVAVSLLNFDLDEETPPSNLTIRFFAREFPRFRWEAIPSAATYASGNNIDAWAPANRLCRWEYLASDVASAYARRIGGLITRAKPQAGAIHGSRETGAPLLQPEAVTEQLTEQLVATTCNLLSGETSGAGRGQLELLQLEPESFFVGLHRKIHRELGSEGLRVFVNLMARILTAGGANEVTLAVADPWPDTHASKLTPAQRRKHARTMERLLAMLSHLEVQRIFKDEDRLRLETSPLLTLLARWNEIPAASPISQLVSPASSDSPAQHWVRLLPDALLRGGSTEAPAARLYKDVPDCLLGLCPRTHPLALGLWLFLRQAWNQTDGESVQRPAGLLLEESGFWIKPAAGFKLVESLKAELQWLEANCLIGAWRNERAVPRNALRNRFTIEARGLHTQNPMLAQTIANPGRAGLLRVHAG